jgi:arabinose operon protein AraL
MVGDRLETDMLMGNKAGISTALVLTGVTQPDDIAHSQARPDFILESIADISSIQGR